MKKRPLAHGFAMTCAADNLPSWAIRFEKAFCDCFLEKHWLTKAEDITQKQLEMIEARYSYIKEGIYLQAFRLFKAYEGRGFKTFRQYCEYGIKKPYIWAKNTIKAAQISWGLLMQGFSELPDNVSQAIRFDESNQKVEQEKPDIAKNWQEVLDSARKEKKPLTANFIAKSITGEIPNSMASARLPRSDWDQLAEKAHKMGKSTQELLQEIVKDYLGEDSTEEPEGDTPPASDGQNMTGKPRNIESEPWFNEMTEMCEVQSTINKNYDTSPDS